MALVTRILVTPNVGAVKREDLERLADLHALLFALDDPAAAVDEVSELCRRLPALEQRLLALARMRCPRRLPITIHQALSMLGNRSLEKLLLELLEDLTILKYELEAKDAELS